MGRLISAAAMAVFLSACAAVPLSNTEVSSCGPRPNQDQAKGAVQAYVRDSGFKDPDTVEVRDVMVGKPLKMYRGLVNGGGWDYGWEIDFQANGKNSYGAYAGYEAHSILLAPDGTVHWQL